MNTTFEKRREWAWLCDRKRGREFATSEFGAEARAGGDEENLQF
jgi:hypothetical protein